VGRSPLAAPPGFFRKQKTGITGLTPIAQDLLNFRRIRIHD